MNKIFDYTNLTLIELIEKISIARFFHLPKMVAEALRKLSTPKYKVYTALLTQSGTDSPVAKVLENTLGGDVIWERTTTGKYIATLTETFKEGKTYVEITENLLSIKFLFKIKRVNTNTVELYTFDNPALTDGALLETPIEIRVYN